MSVDKPEKGNGSFRLRLQELAARFSQAEISRRTDTPLASVHRYLRRDVVPADFCVALVEGLGVNPSWLLNGSGAPWLADVQGETNQMTGNLIELVGAMNAVSRMRLGSLVGKSQSKTLRELSDALSICKDLREKLNERGRPTFRHVLRDWRDALTARNLPEAESLAKAARQFSRLCYDSGLTTDYLSISAKHEMLLGNARGGAQLLRKALLASLAESESLNEPAFAEAFQLCADLCKCVPPKKALRYTRALLTLGQDHGKSWPEYSKLRALQGQLLISAGHGESGVKTLKRVLPALHGAARDVANNSLVLGLVVTGAISFEAAAAMGRGREHAAMLQSIAIWLGAAPELRRAAVVWKKANRGSEESVSHETLIASALLEAVEGGHEEALKSYEKYENALPAKLGMEDKAKQAIRYCQLLLACGDTKQGTQAFVRANDLVRSIDAEQTLGILDKASHFRNALSLNRAGIQRSGIKAVKNKADKFLRRMKKRGNVFLTNVVSQQMLPPNTEL